MHKLDGVQEQGAKQKAAAAVVLPEDGVRAGRDNREIRGKYRKNTSFNQEQRRNDTLSLEAREYLDG